MRITPPVSDGQALPYNVVKINGCADVNVEFTLLEAQPTVGKRRYCNKVLVHECVTVNEASPLDLERAEFIATSDNCYKTFDIYKSSEEVDDVVATITLVLDVDDLTTSILVQFDSSETCCLPLRLAYRLYGYMTGTEERLLLSRGSLYITPCSCDGACESQQWTDVVW